MYQHMGARGNFQGWAPAAARKGVSKGGAQSPGLPNSRRGDQWSA